jgi:hypothetical protein
MSDDLTAQADRRLAEALEAEGSRDPREYYRERLRDLKSVDPEAYRSAVAYYRDTLIPGVASGKMHALGAWTEYGRRLAQSLAPGRTVTVDVSGLAHEYAEPADRSHLVLHLPDGGKARAFLVALPSELSPAQRATYDVLVAGKQVRRA